MNLQPFKSECVSVPSKLAANSAKQQKLLASLSNEPNVRPEEIARGEAIAKDPNYPTDDLLAKLAEVFVNDARRAK